MRPSQLTARLSGRLSGRRRLALALIAPLCASLAAGCYEDPPAEGNPPAGGTAVTFTCNPGDVTTCGTSTCSGVMRCGADGRWPSAEECVFPEELCDGFDQDCDGKIDETFTDLGDSCDYVGATCSGPGVLKCDREAGGVICLPDGPLSTDPEVCDGEDNDCDGDLDEGFNVGGACSAGVGACAARGSYVCAPDQQRAVCDATPGEPVAELCNSLDDDCDGQLDETFDVGGVCSAGVGSCYAEGVYSCNGSGRGVTCSARAGASRPETCDEEDNDCDGKTDESTPAQVTLTHLDLEAAVTLSFTYDADGRVAETAALTASGRAFTLTHEYGDAGALTAQRVAGSASNLRVEYSYDEAGMLVEVTYLDDSDLYGIRSLIYTETGALESSRQDGPLSPWDRAAESDYVCESYSYTAEGALAATTLDLGCDAVADGVVTYTYDEQGALSSAAVTGAWGEGEVSYTYNEQGNLTAEVTAVAGHPLRSERSAYDADGRLATTAIDGGEAGLAVSHRVDRSSVAGELVSTRFDDDGDGAADRVFTYERLDGVVVGAAVDVDGDGEADFDLSFTYDDVTGLHVSTSAFVAGTDGPAVSTWTYTYTAEGLLESDSIDEDFDGVVDLSHAYTYDPQGRVMTQVTTVNPEGESLMYTRSFSYDGDAASPSAATLTGDTAAAGLGAGASATAYSYDDAGRLSGADHSDGEATLSRDDYAYGCWAE